MAETKKIILAFKMAASGPSDCQADSGSSRLTNQATDKSRGQMARTTCLGLMGQYYLYQEATAITEPGKKRERERLTSHTELCGVILSMFTQTSHSLRSVVLTP